ncbi:ornithine cyclodeaminase family protein [Rhodococcus rhodochrous]|uniref:ornithine cyclodeaminase family protein n=1 Tax=Rhodococcus rhodochrous TaxID=1829 RepID=UPI0009BFDA36|nr:ornithine cyclodeaminase family protein [Rhodococcus rhodochrous]
MGVETVLLVSAKDLRELMTPRDAVAAIEEALQAGFNPSAELERTFIDVDEGQLALMPWRGCSSVGVKIASIAPTNPARGLSRIQGLYIHFDKQTLTPRALIDGPALTTLRTPAVSLAAINHVLSSRQDPLDVVVFGAGPQTVGHVEAIVDFCVGVQRIASVTYLVRNLDVKRKALTGPDPRVLLASSAPEETTLSQADVIVCATGSATPVFDAAQVKDDVIVIAVGSHQPDRREVSSDFCARAQVVVEDVETSLRESGDVVMAVAEGVLDVDDIIPMRNVVTASTMVDPNRPVLFQSSGMSWEDAVVAEAAVAALTTRTGSSRNE